MAAGVVAEALLAGVVGVQRLKRFCTVTLMPKTADLIVCASAQ